MEEVEDESKKIEDEKKEVEEKKENLVFKINFEIVLFLLGIIIILGVVVYLFVEMLDFISKKEEVNKNQIENKEESIIIEKNNIVTRIFKDSLKKKVVDVFSGFSLGIAVLLFFILISKLLEKETK